MPPQETATSKPKRSKSKILIFILVLVIAIAAVALILKKDDQGSGGTVLSSTPDLAYVKVSDSGFTPQSLSVKKGTVVVWQVNDSKNNVIIASDPYPKNDGLKDLKSTQLGPGTNYRYKFDSAGRYKYHDDLKPTNGGEIIVR